MREDNIEAFATCAFNHTKEWIAEKSTEDRDRIIKQARKDTPGMIAEFRERKKMIEEEQRRGLEEKEKEVKQKEAKVAAELTELAAKVEGLGGLWKSEDEVEERIASIKSKSRGESVGKVKDALKAQINYRKRILKQPVKNNLDWNFSANNRQFCADELKEKLKAIILQI